MQTLSNPSVDTAEITTNRATRLFRISRVVFYTLAGTIITASVFPLAKKPLRLWLIRWWSKRLLAAFNLQLICKGHIPEKNTPLVNTMFVANHISWADIHAINSVISSRFIAKSDIKSWPVFGYLANKANVLFIDRSKRQDAARIIDTAVLSLQSGDNLCLFPEGTTTDGTDIRPFKSSLFEAAIQANASIWPISIRYPYPDGRTNTGVAYAGETSLLESIQQVLYQKRPVVELCFLAPIHMQALPIETKDRRALARHVQQLIQSNLGL